ncbi:MAG TPA: hypothetical protein VH161_00165 [Candidatus Acidoferrales bacterium]|jgi:hypothetical protein|nr:hypothetical protein [Candidatus Acidoferrales bacterium]
MIDSTEELKKRDYSCEIISAIVLLGLSALSHFWFIAIAGAAGTALWGAVLLLKQAWSLAASRMDEYAAVVRLKGAASQVFPPRKLRQSVDC